MSVDNTKSQSETFSGPIFRCDNAGSKSAFPHFWEHTIGSGHATLTLRADWQAQLKRAHEELGFRYVRFHGILSDDMGTFLIYNDKPLYSFFNTDQIFDFLISIGMKPFVEFSFMPTGLSSGDKIVFHYRSNVTPPKDHTQWSILIHKLVSHWVERYGIEEVRQWFFEVWNEPNLDAFYTGQQEDYFRLYRFTVEAIKSVDPELKVGGPATAMNAWVTEFISFCKNSNLPLDFISTHHYPTDAFGKPGDDTVTQLSQSRRSVLREQAQMVKDQAGTLPVYYTEWSSSSNPRDPLHDEAYAATFIAKTIMEAEGLVEAYSYWTFSDIFEENYFPSMPFHGGFGLLNIYGIAKPAYRAYQLLHDLGAEKLNVIGTHETLDAWAIAGENSLTLLFTNFALPRHDIATVTARMIIENTRPVRNASMRRIGDAHANATLRWREMGEPEYLKKNIVNELHVASELKTESLPIQQKDNTVTFDISLSPLSLASVTLEFA